MKKVLLMFFVLVNLAACSSFDKGRQIKLHGLIVDYEGNGVSSYSVMKGKKEIALTNDSGYFDVDAVYGEEIEFTLKKNEWETVSFKEEKCDLTKLYVFKVRSSDSICREIEERLDEKDFEKIESILDSLPEEFIDNLRIKYLAAMSFYIQGKKAKACEFLGDERFRKIKGNSVDIFISCINKNREEINE